MLSSDSEDNTIMPLFTDWDAIKNYTDEPVSTLVLPAADAWQWALNDNFHGIIINPSRNDLFLNKEQIQDLYNRTTSDNNVSEKNQ